MVHTNIDFSAKKRISQNSAKHYYFYFIRLISIAADDEFQFVGADLNITPIKEKDLGLNVFRSTPAASTQTRVTENNPTETTQSLQTKVESNSLVKRQLFKNSDKENATEEAFDENSQQILELLKHMMNAVVNDLEQVNQSIKETSESCDSDDSNEISFIIEKEPSPPPPLSSLSTTTTLKTSLSTAAAIGENTLSAESDSIELTESSSNIETSTFELKTSKLSNALNGIAHYEEDDSDIEVLTVSAKPVSFSKAIKQESTPNKNIAVLNETNNQNEDLSRANYLTNNALLNSISEHEVTFLVNGGANLNINKEVEPTADKVNEITDETESSALISNYDLITDENTLALFNNDSRQEKSTCKSLVDYSINSNDDSSLNQSREISSAAQQSNQQSNAQTMNSFCMKIDENKETPSKFKHDSSKETTIYIEETTSNFTRQDVNLTNSSKPFFASKLTNSQLSEELSNEIGL